MLFLVAAAVGVIFYKALVRIGIGFTRLLGILHAHAKHTKHDL